MDVMSSERPYAERLQLSERLRLAKKQRSQQLKAYEQREKQLAKEEAIASKKSGKKGKVAGSENNAARMLAERRRRLRFNESIIMMDATAHNDVEEGQICFCIFNFVLMWKLCGVTEVPYVIFKVSQSS